MTSANKRIFSQTKMMHWGTRLNTVALFIRYTKHPWNPRQRLSKCTLRHIRWTLYSRANRRKRRRGRQRRQIMGLMPLWDSSLWLAATGRAVALSMVVKFSSKYLPWSERGKKKSASSSKSTKKTTRSLSKSWMHSPMPLNLSLLT